MQIVPFLGLPAAAVVGALAAGCASRQLPSSYPPHSPASASAPAGPAAIVTSALDGEPAATTDSAASPPRHEGHSQQGSGQPDASHEHEGHHGHHHQ